MSVRQVHMCSVSGGVSSGGDDSTGGRDRDCRPDRILHPKTCKINFYTLNFGSTVRKTSVYIKNKPIFINSLMRFSN